MIEQYLGKKIEAYTKIGNVKIVTGEVVDTGGDNMLFVEDSSGEDFAITLSSTVIKIIS